jgi:hypothetical protein
MTPANKLRAWVLDTLSNNETDGDAELVEYFTS